MHTELIAAARQAGADQVLPRSAFAGNLAEILLSAWSHPLITRSDIVAASARIAPYVVRTPLRRSEWLSAATGADVSLKLEVAQVVLLQDSRRPERGAAADRGGPMPAALVTASAGNHGQGLAFAAAVARLPLIVYVPEAPAREAGPDACGWCAARAVP